MSVIIKAADQHQNAVNHAADAVTNGVYAPSANGVLKLIGMGASLIGVQDTFTQRVSSFKSIKDAKGIGGTVKALMSNYDAAIARSGDALSRQAGASVYYLVKQGLNLATLTVLSRSKVGRIVQEGIATVAGLSVRLAIKVAEYVTRALPYLIVLAGLALGGYKVGLAFAALYGISKIGFAAAVAGTGIVSVVIAQQTQIHDLWIRLKNLRKANKDLREDIEKAKQPMAPEPTLANALGQKVVDIGQAVNRNKGKIALGLAAGGAGAALYHFGPPAFAVLALGKVETFFSQLFTRTPKDGAA